MITLGCAHCDYVTYQATLDMCRTYVTRHRVATDCGKKAVGQA